MVARWDGDLWSLGADAAFLKCADDLVEAISYFRDDEPPASSAASSASSSAKIKIVMKIRLAM